MQTLKASELVEGDEVRVHVVAVDKKGRRVTLKMAEGGEFAVPSTAELTCQRRSTAGAGGEKGEAILAALRKAPKGGATPSEVAERVGCHVNRVYEVLRTVETTSPTRGRYRLAA